MKSMKYLKNSLGMTLIEVLVAIGLFAIAAIPLLGVFHESVITNADSKIRTKEATIAQSIAEDIKAGVLTDDNFKQFIIYENNELANKGLIIKSIESNGEISNLKHYVIKISSINFKTEYTLDFLGPITNIRWNVPDIESSGNTEPIDYKNLTNFFTIFGWGILFTLFFTLSFSNLSTVINIVATEIKNAFDWRLIFWPIFIPIKNKYGLYQISVNIVNDIKSQIGITIKIPQALQWWNPNYEWRWFFDPSKWSWQ